MQRVREQLPWLGQDSQRGHINGLLAVAWQTESSEVGATALGGLEADADNSGGSAMEADTLGGAGVDAANLGGSAAGASTSGGAGADATNLGGSAVGAAMDLWTRVDSGGVEEQCVAQTHKMATAITGWTEDRGRQV